MNETTSDGINQLHDQHEIGVNNETQPIASDQYKVSYNEPKDTTVSVGNSASSDVVQKLCSPARCSPAPSRVLTKRSKGKGNAC